RRLPVAEDVDIELERACEELVYQRGLVELELLRPSSDAHPAPAQHVVRTDEHRIADALCDRPRLRAGCCGSPGWGTQPEVAEQSSEATAVLRALDRRQRVTEQREARAGNARRQRERRLTAELHDNTCGLLQLADVERALQRERFEIEPVARVVVGRHRLRVGVEKHRLVTET